MPSPDRRTHRTLDSAPPMQPKSHTQNLFRNTALLNARQTETLEKIQIDHSLASHPGENTPLSGSEAGTVPAYSFSTPDERRVKQLQISHTSLNVMRFRLQSIARRESPPSRDIAPASCNCRPFPHNENIPHISGSLQRSRRKGRLPQNGGWIVQGTRLWVCSLDYSTPPQA